jgi:hypothetical protein
MAMETRSLVREKMLDFIGSDAKNVQGFTLVPPGGDEGLLVLWIVNDRLESKTFRFTEAAKELVAGLRKAVWYGSTNERTGEKLAVFFTWLSEDEYQKIIHR